jgi:hypothetical protein
MSDEWVQINNPANQTDCDCCLIVYRKETIYE